MLALIMVLALAACSDSNNNNSGNNADVTTNYYTLARFNYDGDFTEFQKDSYRWYKSIESEKGIYLINTSYYSQEVLDAWEANEVCNSMPINPFWMFRASPSYLEQINITIEEEYLNEAISGVRIYMIPDTLSTDEIENMSSYLEEDAKKTQTAV